MSRRSDRRPPAGEGESVASGERPARGPSPARRAAARLAAALLLLTAHAAARGPRAAGAQPIPSPEYVTYLPGGLKRAVDQTDASARFHPFGDPAAPGYRDASPRNGVDDRRDTLLTALAVAFAPWMVRNAYGFPTDLEKLVREHDAPLVVDRFDLARYAPRRLSSDTLRLGRAPGTPGFDDAADARLLALLERLGPQAARTSRASAAPTSDTREVLYLDTPGGDPKSWAREYGEAGGFRVNPRYVGYAKTYVHPFVAEVAPGADGRPRYEVVLQYWFYYPTNDAGNVHEGDSEHLNAVLAPRDRVGQPLDSATVAAILDGTLGPDALVLRRVEYYFHYWVYPVDFARPNAYAPRAAWAEEVRRLPATRVGERAHWARVRERAYLDDAETQVNRHPVVLIGGDGRGLNLLLRAPSALGLSTHGSYPFRGLWKATGPAGTGESVNHDDHVQRHPPPADAPETESVVRYDSPGRVEILPDWEQLAPLALEDRAVRWRYAWFLLPLYLGYPATVSPFAGIVRFADTGNNPPGAPPYNGGWNRIGDGEGSQLYAPQYLGSLAPYDVQDNYNPRWGFLNLAEPTLRLLPPFDLAARLVVRPAAAALGRGLPTYARTENLAARRVGLGFGVTRSRPSGDFARLVGFPELLGPLFRYARQFSDAQLPSTEITSPRFDALTAWRGEINFHLGSRFVTTNGLSHGTAAMRQEVTFADTARRPMAGALNLWEYAGTLRYNLAPGRVQPFAEGGYGLSWYRLQDVTVGGTALGSSRWVRRPGWLHNLLPNTGHVGGGVEVLPSYGFGHANVGVKAVGAWYLHDLGLKTADDQPLFIQNTRVSRWKMDLLATVAY